MPGLVTVTMPAATRQLTTLANVHEALNITDTSRDGFLQRLINRASGIITNELNRPLGVETLAEVFRVTPAWEPQLVGPYGTPLNGTTKPLILSRTPVVTIASLSDCTGALDGTGYEVEPNSGLLWRLYSSISRGSWGAPPVMVTYTAGYTLPGDVLPGAGPPLPDDIEDVCITLITSAWFAASRDPNLQLEVIEGVGRQSYWDRSTSGMALDEETQRQLAPYVNQAW